MPTITNLDPRKFPAGVMRKAKKCLTTCSPKRIDHHKHQRTHTLHKIDVGFRFRLLSFDNGETWELYTHETYSSRFLWS